MNHLTNTQLSRFAVIDIGTSAIRLEIAELDPETGFRILDDEREMVRLGRGLSRGGRMAAESMAAAIDAIGRMKAIAAGFGVRRIRAVATSAVRDAANREDFCREASRRHGLRIEVLPGDEEARAAFASAAHHFHLSGPCVVIDVGGGSLEIACGSSGVARSVTSLPLGAVTLTDGHCRSDPMRCEEKRALQEAIGRALDDGLPESPFRPEIAVVSGGTANALARMALAAAGGGASSIHGHVLSRELIQKMTARLVAAPLAERRRIPGLNPARADIVVAGALILGGVVDRLSCAEVIVNERGIRGGILRGMIADARGSRLLAEVDRFASVRALARKCHSPETHCEHVARLSSDLLDDLAPHLELPPGSRTLLFAAALLHEVGRFIGYTKHHKHAYHLILHGDLKGFSAREVELIANVARYHRGSAPKKSHPGYDRLGRSDRRLVKVLGAILRFANALDRAHAQSVDRVRCRKQGRRLQLTVDTASPLLAEIAEATRATALLEEAMGLRVNLELGQVKRPTARVPQEKLALATR